MYHFQFVTTIFIALIFMVQATEIDQEIPNEPLQNPVIYEQVQNPAIEQESQAVQEQNLSNGCDNGYDYDPDIECYKVIIKNIIWKDARDSCKADGADLVLVQSAEEAKALQNIINKNEITLTWIPVRAKNSDWKIIQDQEKNEVSYKPDFCNGQCFFQKVLPGSTECLIFRSANAKKFSVYNKNCDREIKSYMCQKSGVLTKPQNSN